MTKKKTIDQLKKEAAKWGWGPSIIYDPSIPDHILEPRLRMMADQEEEKDDIIIEFSLKEGQ